MSFALPPPGKFPDRPVSDDRPISDVYPHHPASSVFKNRLNTGVSQKNCVFFPENILFSPLADIISSDWSFRKLPANNRRLCTFFCINKHRERRQEYPVNICHCYFLQTFRFELPNFLHTALIHTHTIFYLNQFDNFPC